MRILNISTLIPLPGLRRENDIILKVQQYLEKQYGFQFVVAKSVPFVTRGLAEKRTIWKLYHKYQTEGDFRQDGYFIKIYPWIMPPSSHFLLNYPLLLLNRLFILRRVVRKLDSLRTDEIDLIVTQNLFPDAVVGYYASRRYGIPYVMNLRLKREWGRALTLLPGIRCLFKKASTLFTHSPSLLPYFGKWLDLQFIPHPVETEFVFNGTKAYDKLRLTSICRLLPMKNLDWVIKSLAEAKKRGYDFEYNILGDGEALETLRALTLELGLTEEIVFHGHVQRQQVIEQLRKAHVFVMPSNPETLGRVYLEAAAAGCICIGHKDSGVHGLFEHGVHGFFVQKHSLTDVMLLLFSNFSEEYFSQFVEQTKLIIDGLTWQYVGELYKDLYEKNALSA